MTRPTLRSDRPGIALAVVLLVLLAVGAIATSAALISSNAVVIHSADERQSLLEAAVDAGLEEARALINGDRDLYPDSGYVVLENAARVYDAMNREIPGIRRSTYVGPTGATTGQYGVFGSIVTVAEDANGDRVIRRAEVTQESFARFAYFTDVEPSNIAFGGGDQIFGPVHTNDVLKIYPSRATFYGPVTTARTISGEAYGTFRQGYTENAPRIPMPQTAELDKLRDLAAAGGMVFTGTNSGSQSQATLRIEFVAIDLNGDGDATDGNEGFIKVYSASDPRWVVADVPGNYGWRGLEFSPNCGHYHGATFVAAIDHPNNDDWIASLVNGGRCYLGGSDSLFGGFNPVDAYGGRWLPWPGAVSPVVAATGRADAGYLFPISRALNPDFKGVIFVDGKVAVSGVVRGHVTLAATNDIIIVDDLTYAIDPGSAGRNCLDGSDANDDILGLFSGDDIIVADNTINAPKRPNPQGGGAAANYRTFDDTSDEFVHAVVLALDIFTVGDYAGGARTAERCESRLWGRGCLYLTGGIIQRTRGAVATITNPGGTGYLKRYSYDSCAFSSPPPYFPTTGRFARGHYFEVDPVGFDVAEYFDLLTAGS